MQPQGARRFTLSSTQRCNVFFTVNMEFSNRGKLILLLGVPSTLLLLYWLLRGDKDEDEEEMEEKRKVTTSRQTIIELSVPAKAVGAVIGRQGANIKKIQEESGARVNFQDDKTTNQDQDRMVVIRGNTESAQNAELLIRKIIADMPVIITEEIFVPSRALGRIIGRNGETVKSMSRSSKAKIIIERTRDESRDTPRSVTITGTRDQVDLAKTFISEKLQEEEVFRAKAAVMAANRDKRTKSSKENQVNRGTTHITEQQTYKITESAATQSDTLGGFNWPEGKEYVEVYVSAVASPSNFWIQILTSMAVQLDELVSSMASLYSSEISTDYLVSELSVGDMVAAPFENDPSWYRAKVMGVEGNKIDIFYVDYGDSVYIEKNKLRKLCSQFLSLPFQAVECCLANIQPSGDSWSEECIEIVEDLTYCAKWKVIMAKKVGQKLTDTGVLHVLELINTNGPKDVNINQELVRRGFAMWDETDTT